MAATKPQVKTWEVPKDLTTKLLMFVITLLLSAITFISGMIVNKVNQIDAKVEMVSRDVQEIKVVFAKYQEKVDAIEKKEDKK